MEEDKIKTLEATVVRLEEQVKRAKTLTDEDTVQAKLTSALKRLETLEGKYQQPKKEEVEEEEVEEDGDQCPVCGYVLNEMGDGKYYCPGCREYFEEE